MQHIHAGTALLPDGWANDVRIGIEAGRISSVDAGVSPFAGDERCAVAVPGMPNLHSHVFQRGMAGLAEVRGPSADSFWTWRNLMYRFALTMTPEQLEVVASQAYIEMLESGFARVGEFHYLHHDRDGQPYADIAETASRIAAASSRTGIALTLLPVFYAHSGFGGRTPVVEQRRFVNDLDRFERLLHGTRGAVASLDGAVVGVAPHSLRAVTPHELNEVREMQPEGPFHIHIAEQQREVDDCLAWSGARPVDWLLNHVEVDDRWCLIHATHMSASEVERLARSGAVAGLCPVTEANLGDGTFSGAAFVQYGGRYGIGTDSNVRIGVVDELRQLEYSQRLEQRARNMMATGGRATGRAVFESALRGGETALGASGSGIGVGSRADIVTLESDLMPVSDGDAVLNTWIFAQGVRVDDVWVSGRRVVHEGRHAMRDEVSEAFRLVMGELLGSE